MSPSTGNSDCHSNSFIFSIAFANCCRIFGQFPLGVGWKQEILKLICIDNINGKIVVEKHTTGRILKMIAAGVITAKAKGKASSDGTYLPLAQFQEFTDAIENQLARRTAAVRKEDMGSLYARVAKAEANRHKWRSAKNVFSGLVGWTSLIIWVGGILVVAWLAFMYGGQLVKQAASSLGFSPETTTSAPADNSTGNTAL